jgi:hypothetical protein
MKQAPRQFDPPQEVTVGDESAGIVLQALQAGYTPSGRLVATLQLWNGSPLAHERLPVDSTNARHRYAAHAAEEYARALAAKSSSQPQQPVDQAPEQDEPPEAGDGDQPDEAQPATATMTAAPPGAQPPALDTGAVGTALLKMAVLLHQVLGAASQGTPSAPAQEEAERRQTLDVPGLVAVAADEHGAPVYVLQDPSTGALSIAPHVEHRDGDTLVLLVPPAEVPWALPRAQAIIEHHGELTARQVLDEALTWVKQASELRHATDYLLVALFILLTYVLEQVNYCPIVLLEAEPERGKTRTGKAIIYAARHGVHVPGLRESNLLRDAQDRQATLFLDLKDLWAKAEKQGCEDVLLARFERGLKVPRVLYPDRGPHADTVYYTVFGPTVIATNESIHRILDTRCVRLDMPLSVRTFPDLTPAAARPLVELLTAWRAVMLRQSLASCDKLPGRLGDILKPLRQVLLTVAPELAGKFDTIAERQDRRRKEEKAASTEAAIVRTIGASITAVEHGYLPIAVVLDALNGTRPPEHQLTAKWLGTKIRALGFTVERVGHANITSLQWDGDLLARLLEQYGTGSADPTRTTTHTDPGTPSHNVLHVSHVSPTSDEECDTLGRCVAQRVAPCGSGFLW